jgi:sigma-B regulation protein RsbU (phosphoserine phosphatase)
MSKTFESNIVNKLALQVDSFQEGFELLSAAKNVTEMGKQFATLLRDNFLISDINIFHKVNKSSDWKTIHGNSTNYDESFKEINDERLLIKYDEVSEIKVRIILPLIDKSIIGIAIGAKLDKSSFTEFDKISLQIFIQLLDNAYQSFINRQNEKDLIFELNQRVLQLNNLIDTGIDLTKFENRNTLLELAIARAAVLTDASYALVQVIKEEEVIDSVTFPPGMESSLVTNDDNKISASFNYQEHDYSFILSGKESRIGTASFTDLDQILLDAISRQVNAAIENDFLHQESLIKERIEQELNVAASIQQIVIPRELPEIPGYDVAGINIPSREVGGDYYDCIDLGDGRFAIVMADVAGKGIAAALLVNTLNASLYAYLDNNTPLPEMTDNLNKIIYNASPSDKFITYFITILNTKTGELDIVNAGHNPILLLRTDGSMDKIEAGGVGLGMFDFGIPFSGQKSIMNPGDKLFLYTDGIPEAMNEEDEEYSDERMIKFFKEHSEISSKEFINAVVKDVKNYAGDAQQSDDITVLILKRN